MQISHIASRIANDIAKLKKWYDKGDAVSQFHHPIGEP